MNKEKTATKMVVHCRSVTCPHCGYENEGWLESPLGGAFDCDNCGKTYYVPSHIEMEWV
jgi:transposase